MVLILSLTAILAVPATATGEPKIFPANEKFPVSFTVYGGLLELRTGFNVVCSSHVASGTFTSASTGVIEESFQGCTSGWSHCTSAGQAKGTITFPESIFHLVYLTDAKSVPGVLITPPAGGVFATTVCTGAIKGAGYMGSIESACSSIGTKTYSLNYELEGKIQKYRQITGTGATYSLLAGSTEFPLVMTTTWTLAQQAILGCV
jgi:hypothetical protein